MEAELESTLRLPSPPSIVFLPPVFYDTGGYSPYTGSAAVADFNGDRKPDFAHANLCADPSCTTNGNVAVFMGNGDGTFQGAVLYDAGGIYTQFVAAADVSNDGRTDLLVANTLSNTVGVLFGNGDGTFQPVVTYSTGGDMPNAIAAADVNGDGIPDLVVTNSNSGTVGVLLGNGDGTFQPVKTYGAGGAWPISLAVADVNRDGKLDVVVANLDTDAAGVLIGNGDGSFQPAVTYSSGNYGVYSITVADINRDGKPDIIMANCDLGDDNTCIDEKRDGAVSILLGDGDGTFETAMSYDSGGSGGNDVTVADVSGDGFPDLIVANNCNPGCSAGGQVAVLLGKFNGTFQSPITYDISYETVNSVTIADVNGDGKLDLLVVAGASWSNGGVGVMINNTAIAPRFTQTTLTTSESPSLVGQPVGFVATVTSKKGQIPDGETVTFYDGTTAIGTGTTASGVVMFTTSSLNAKTHDIKATYPGDATFKPSSGSVTQVVTLYATTTTLSTNPNSTIYGESVILTAQVTATSPTAPTGKVTFKNGTTSLGAVNVTTGGVAMLNKSNLPVGSDSLTATYGGDVTNEKSVSTAVTQTVNLAQITMTLNSSPNPSIQGASVKFTATLSSNGGLPNGQKITFSYNGSPLGTTTISGGKASLSTTTLPAGSDVVTATYSGDANHSSATASVAQAVN